MKLRKNTVEPEGPKFDEEEERGNAEVNVTEEVMIKAVDFKDKEKKILV